MKLLSLALMLSLCLASAFQPVMAAEPTPAKPEAAKPSAVTPEQIKAALAKKEGERMLGNPNATVQLVEYASLSCPHCAHFHSNILPSIKKDYIDSQKVGYIYRDFALNAPAIRGAMISQCMDESRYFTFLNALYAQQSDWAFNEKFLEKLTRLAQLGGMKDEAIKKCLGDTALETRLLKQKQDAIQILGVQSTPTLFINGTPIRGIRDAAVLKANIDAALAGQPLPGNGASAPTPATAPAHNHNH